MGSAEVSVVAGVFGLVGAIAGAGIAWGILRQQVRDHDRRVLGLEAKMEAVMNVIAELRTGIAECRLSIKAAVDATHEYGRAWEQTMSALDRMADILRRQEEHDTSPERPQAPRHER